jgi:hypothetical protein
MSLRQKGNYAPPEDQAWGLTFMMANESLAPYDKKVVQPQLKNSQATKTCQDHIKTFTHKRAYI